MQYTHTLKNNIYHSDKEGPPSFFHPDTNPVIPHALFHSVNKTHVLVVTVKLIWLLFWNKFSFNFVPTPRKSLRFTRFRRSYLNRPAVLTNFGSVLTNHCQGYTVCCLICAVQSGQVPLFLQLFVPNDSAFALLSTPVARMWTHVDVDR